MVRVWLAAFVVLLGFPALAEEEVPTVSLAAKAMLGFADGAHVGFGGLGQPTIRETRPGAFQVIGTDKKRALITFIEPEPCKLQITVKADPPQNGSMEIDLSLLTAITIVPEGEEDGIPKYRMTVAAKEGGLTEVSNGQRTPRPTIESPMYTDVPGPEMEAAATELLTRCAGFVPAAPLELSSPVDLLAVIVGGLAPGARVNFNGVEGPVEKVFDGFYRISPATGEPAAQLSIHQEGRCRFLFVIEQSSGTFSARLDANLVSALSVTADGTRGDLASYKAIIEGADGRLMTKAPGGDWEKAASADSYMSTSLSLGDIEAAIERFRTEYCPGISD